MDDETFERIPWEHLSGSKPSRNPLPPRKIAYLAAGAVAVAGLAAALMTRGEAVPPSTSLAAPTTASTSALTTSTTLLSEASLRAFPGVGDEAAAWAEWLTETYLTVDGSDPELLASLLPAESALPAPAAGQRVFVESARAISVTEEGTSYRSVVLARLLGAAGAESYSRLPDRAFVWTLRWEPEGWVVIDLPEEVAPPQLRAGPSFVNEQVPEPILSAAAQRGSVIGGGMVGDLWRVVVTVEDRLGGAWPVVVWFSPDGSPVAATASG